MAMLLRFTVRLNPFTFHLQPYSCLFAESGEARETFGGKLTPDFIVEKLGHSNFSGKISTLDGFDMNFQFSGRNQTIGNAAVVHPWC